MRYQRIRYRYALVTSTGTRRVITGAGSIERHGIMLADTCWRPPSDLAETANEIVVTVELAAVDEEQINVLLYEDAVIVEGERHCPPLIEQAIYHQAEIRQGQFRLELPLPASIDTERAQAVYEYGLLRLSLPKA